MKFNIIVAMDKNRGIGLNNQLPWSFKEDIAYFKNLTKGAGNNAIIMGKNTYHSINKEYFIKHFNQNTRKYVFM